MARSVAAERFSLGGGRSGGWPVGGGGAFRRAPSSFPSSVNRLRRSRRPRPPPRALTPEQVRAILAQEGAQMVGRPRRNGRDIVAIGRGDAGARKRFTLDAVTGEVLDVTVLRPPRGAARHSGRRRPRASGRAPGVAAACAGQLRHARRTPGRRRFRLRRRPRHGFDIQVERGRRFRAQPDPAPALARGAQGRAAAAMSAKNGRLNGARHASAYSRKVDRLFGQEYASKQ